MAFSARAHGTPAVLSSFFHCCPVKESAAACIPLRMKHFHSIRFGNDLKFENPAALITKELQTVEYQNDRDSYTFPKTL
jgi:hypothetical protein